MMEGMYNICRFLTYGLRDECQSTDDALNYIIFTNENIKNSIGVFSSILATHSDSSLSIKLYIPLISALVGAFSAFIFNRFHWQWTEKKKKETDLFYKISAIISELETLAIEYWTKDRSDSDEKSEVSIKSKMRLIQKYIRAINVRDKSIENELNQFASDIFDLVTGDDFESKRRRASKAKAISISYKCADIFVSISRYC